MPLYDFLVNHPYGTTGETPIAGEGFFWRPDINDVTELAAFITVGLGIDTRIDCLFDDVLKPFVLLAGPADVGDPGQIAPDDYNVSTNDVHWQVMG